MDSSSSRQKFKLTSSNVARYFKHRCDRLFRWDAVPSVHREKRGIGWNVPKKDRTRTRPAVRLLMGAGDTFELERLRALQDRLGEDQVYVGDIVTGRGGRQVVEPLPMSLFKDFFSGGSPPAFAAQLQIDLAQSEEERFLKRFGLPPEHVTLGAARPDLIEIVREEEGHYRLKVWDYKASPEARHEHFIQVAYYSLLLEDAVAALGLEGVSVDQAFGVIRSRQDEPEEFELHPYRLAVADFLRSGVPELLNTPAAQAHFHVCAKCLLCEYLDMDRGCQVEADASRDLSRVAYITSQSKRRLREAGLQTHRELARLDPGGPQAEHLSTLSHDLSVNLDRYIASARALEDGRSRPLANSTLQMPYWEDVRIVLSAEQDGVTGTCFALGVKTFEGWNGETGRPDGLEEVFVAEDRGQEDELLLDFLQVLNGILERVDAKNRTIAQVPIEEEAGVREAGEALARAKAELAAFKAEHPRLHRYLDSVEKLRTERIALEKEVKDTTKAVRQARRDAKWRRRRRQRSLHIYFYDQLDLEALKSALERNLLDASPELRREIVRLVRLFPPDSVLADAESFRTIPGTVVAGALRRLVALPVPYLYDLETVSRLYRPQKASGEEGGYEYRPAYGFGWEHSNQVAFERIHDVWEGRAFETQKGAMMPSEVLEGVRRAILNKLRATDSVIRRLRQDHKTRREKDGVGLLLLRKEPFRLHDALDPTDFELVEALEVFALVEAALGELQTKHLHTLSVADRAAKFEAVRGLRYLGGEDEEGGAVLWFTFDPSCRDAKFTEGDWSLVVTPEDEPKILINSVDGPLFAERAGWRYKNFRVTLEAFEREGSLPRLALRPDNPAGFRKALDLSKVLVLDKLHEDFLTERVLDTLRRLRAAPDAARHVADLIRHGTVPEWSPFFRDTNRVEYDFRKRVKTATDDDGQPLDPESILNPEQWRAWRGAFFEPLSMVWGPPGTGKTHLVAHMLIGYALAAQRLGRPLRILVTAATHHAIVNVLAKTLRLARRYGLSEKELGAIKVGRTNAADAELPEGQYARVEAKNLSATLSAEEPGCLVAGSTVWSLYKAMRGARGPGRPFFDVVLIDEASQVRLPDALIAFAASKPESNVILAGDDQQLPPIIRGTYPEEHEPMLSSVFAFARHKMEERAGQRPSIRKRVLFQLTRNYRMNEPLTAYPRAAVYGDYEATFSTRRIQVKPEIDLNTTDAAGCALCPARPVVLATYEAPQSFTARNPVEASFAAQLVRRLGQTLIDETTGAVYEPVAFAEQGVAVLAPHRAQNATIRSALGAAGFGSKERPMPLVDTVEKLQGKERDVIIVSYGVADAEYADAEAEFLLSRNRFNVAATRGRAKLVVICSEVVLNAVPDERRVLLESMMLKEFRTFCSDGCRTLMYGHAEFGDIPFTLQWKAFSQDDFHQRGDGRRGLGPKMQVSPTGERGRE